MLLLRLNNAAGGKFAVPDTAAVISNFVKRSRIVRTLAATNCLPAMDALSLFLSSETVVCKCRATSPENREKCAARVLRNRERSFRISRFRHHHVTFSPSDVYYLRKHTAHNTVLIFACSVLTHLAHADRSFVRAHSMRILRGGCECANVP